MSVELDSSERLELPSRLALVAGLTMLFLLFTRVSDAYRPVQSPISLNQGIVLVALGMLLVQARRLRFDRGLVAMLGYGAALALSALAAAHPALTASELFAYAHDVVIVFVLLNVATTWNRFRLVTWTLVVAGAVAAALGLVHAFTGSDFGGLSRVDVGNLAGDEAGVRLAGTIGNSNAYAQMLVCAVPLALYRTWSEPNRAARVVALAATALMCTVIMWTYSRSGGIALVAVLVIALAYRRFRARYVMTVVLLGLIGAVCAPHTYVDRVVVTTQYIVQRLPHPTAQSTAGGHENAPGQVDGRPQTPAAQSNGAPTNGGPLVDEAPRPNDGSLPERLALLRVGLLMFRDHPWIGVGKGNYLSAFPDYARQVDSRLAGQPKVTHNTPLQILADTGVVGLTTFVILVLLVVAGLRGARQLSGRHHMLLEPVELGIGGYLITALFNSDDFPRFLWLLLGLAMAGRQIVSRERAHSACS